MDIKRLVALTSVLLLALACPVVFASDESSQPPTEAECNPTSSSQCPNFGTINTCCEYFADSACCLHPFGPE